MHPFEIYRYLNPEPYSNTTSPWANELFVEMVFWVTVSLITIVLLILRPAFFRRLEAIGTRIARRQGLAVAITILAALGVRALLLPWMPYPEPMVHDEFSYWLQAETFASGRLTNPTPPAGIFFETFHVNIWPTYESMYPPAHALPMAAAVALHLHPWWGVWLSMGLMCGAICWMLQGWMPPQWAFLGGMFAVFRYATFDYWVNSYFGGAVAALGGALLLGALPRIKRSPRARYFLWFALGLAVLANSRPYEGFVFSIPATISLLLWMAGWRRKKPLRVMALAPALAFLILVGVGMGYYNWRGTGSAVVMPYQVNQRQYHITRPFIWQTAYPIPNYHHQAMRTMYVFHELPDYLNRRYSHGLWIMMRVKLESVNGAFVWPMLALFVVSTWVMFRSQRMRLLATTFVLVWAGLLIEQWPPNPHYAAPFTCVTIAIMLFGLRLACTWKPKGLPAGSMLARAIVLVLFAWMMFLLAGLAIDPYGLAAPVSHLHAGLHPTFDRDRLMAQLEQKPGQHIIILHNARSALGLSDWVYNGPDFENAKVIWARDMGPVADQQLIEAYPNRHVWYVNQDDGIMRLDPYEQHYEELDPARILHVAANQPFAVER